MMLNPMMAAIAIQIWMIIAMAMTIVVMEVYMVVDIVLGLQTLTSPQVEVIVNQRVVMYMVVSIILFNCWLLSFTCDWYLSYSFIDSVLLLVIDSVNSVTCWVQSQQY